MIDSKRRRLFAGSAALALGACAPLRSVVEPAVTADAGEPTVDLHSHAGALIPSRTTGFARPFVDVAGPMRAGGMDVVCLAVVADTPVTRVDSGRVRAWREPGPGELHAFSVEAFARARELVALAGLTVVTDAASMRDAAGRRRAAVIASEGADFLEGRVDRLDEVFERDGLRHLQLTHYRVNELGDIQTAPPEHGALTDFGRAVVRRCDERGIVIDVAHAPLAMVRDVVDATSKPIVLSHTSLADRPGPTSRLISPQHARLVASTGGVIGVWPPASRFPTMAAYARGIAAMVDAVGVDHVGLGTDLLGLTGPAIFSTYAQLPVLVDALHEVGFDRSEITRITGANYARAFVARMAR